MGIEDSTYLDELDVGVKVNHVQVKEVKHIIG